MINITVTWIERHTIVGNLLSIEHYAAFENNMFWLSRECNSSSCRLQQRTVILTSESWHEIKWVCGIYEATGEGEPSSVPQRLALSEAR